MCVTGHGLPAAAAALAAAAAAAAAVSHACGAGATKEGSAQGRLLGPPPGGGWDQRTWL